MRILILILSCISSLMLSANESNLLIVFETVGPDRYRDGDIVEDGEKYALVWQRADITNVVFNIDGTIDSSLNDVYFLRALPRAENGHCKQTVISVNKDQLPKLSGTGKLCLYLLDTRKIDENGNVELNDDIIHGSRLVAKSNITTGTADISYNLSFLDSNLNVITSIPIFTDISIQDKDILLEVSNVTNTINYIIKDKDNRTVSKHPITGNNSKIHFNVAKDKQMNLYKVSR